MLGLFTDKFEIAHARLAVAGYADTVPADTNETSEGRAKNRRVDVTILSQTAFSMEAKSGGASEPPSEGQKTATEGGPKKTGH
jgi:chemotaxis protein MotB